MNPEANASKRVHHDPVAIGVLKEAAEMVGLDVGRVLTDGARLELSALVAGGAPRAVLTVSVLLSDAETAALVGRVVES